MGNGTLHVYINGVRQEPNYGYTETSTTQVTFDSAPALNDVILFLINPFVNQTTADSVSVTYDNSSSGLTATNAQAAIDEIVDEFVPNTRATSYGFYTTVNATDPTNDIDISAGQCWDTTRASFMVGSAMTKQADATWSAGNNGGFLDTGTLSSDEGYHIYVMRNQTTGAVDYIMSLSGTWAGVTEPSADWSKGQIIGYAYRDTAWIEMGWSGNSCNYDKSIQAFSDSTITDSTYETYDFKPVPRNSLGYLYASASNATMTNATFPIYARHTLAGSDPWVNDENVIVSSVNSSDPVTAIGGSFVYLVDASRQLQMATYEITGSANMGARVHGFNLCDRLEATS